MRAGGGKDKGSSWEREVGKLLSLWLTHGARPDIFSRNVLSGGAFTNASSKGELSSRMPGDLMAAHPLAFTFMSKYAIECKHLASLGLEQFLFDDKNSSELSKIISFADGQARAVQLDYMIVAKQNRREPFVITAGSVGRHILEAGRVSSRIRIAPPHHYLHRGRIFMMKFGTMCTVIDPDRLLIG